MRPTDLPRGFELKFRPKERGDVERADQVCRIRGQALRFAKELRSYINTVRTKLAAMATRSIAVQTEDPAKRGISLWDWLTPTTVTSTATQTSDPGAGGRSLKQWRSIQGKFLLDLQKVQHCMQQTLEQCRDPGRKPRACSPTAMLEQLKERIRNISQDMHVPHGSCGEESFLPDTSAEVRAQKEAQSSTEEGKVCQTGLQRHPD